MILNQSLRGNTGNQKESERTMKKDIDDNNDISLHEAAADLGAIKMEIFRKKKYYGEHTKRMAELKKLAELQEMVVHRMLDKSVEEHNQPKRSHLTVVK